MHLAQHRDGPGTQPPRWPRAVPRRQVDPRPASLQWGDDPFGVQVADAQSPEEAHHCDPEVGVDLFDAVDPDDIVELIVKTWLDLHVASLRRGASVPRLAGNPRSGNAPESRRNCRHDG